MPRVKKIMRRDERALFNLFKLFMIYHNFLPFHNYAPFPCDSDLCEILALQGRYGNEYVSVQGGEGVPHNQRVVENADRIHAVIRRSGGLELIRKIVRELAREMPLEWGIISKRAQVPSHRYPTITAIANEYGIDRTDIYDKCDYFIELVARVVIMERDSMFKEVGK